MLAKTLARVDAIDADIAALDARVEQMIAPFTAAAQRLDQIPGINAIAAGVILAEIGIDTGRFPTAGHLVSGATFAPGVKESRREEQGQDTTGPGQFLPGPGARQRRRPGRPDRHLPGERHRRSARRPGRKKAAAAIGRSILIIIWHLPTDPSARNTDLGSDLYDTRINPERRKRNHTRQLEAPGYNVTLQPAA